MRAIKLPQAVPPTASLRDLFRAPLMRVVNGAEVQLRLPCHRAAIQLLLALGHDVEALLEAEDISHAHTLSIVVSSALHGISQLHVELGDELTVAGRVDELFGRILSLCCHYLGGALKRKRNQTEYTLTDSLMRPDFLVLCDETLLFKGEDKVGSLGGLAAAQADVLKKCSEWTTYYHGQVEYLLVYACAGSSFQLSYIDRLQPNALHPLTEVLNTDFTTGKVGVIHAAILTYAIIMLQRKQLPAGSRLLKTESCGMGGKITYHLNSVVKRVPWARLEELGVNLDDLKELYSRVADSKYVVQAVNPQKEPKVTDGKYIVTLQPNAQSINEQWRPSLQQLIAAMRCILLGLQEIHAVGFGHGDMRWPNVIMETSSRFRLIDLELSVRLGCNVTERLRIAGVPDDQVVARMPLAWEGGAALMASAPVPAGSEAQPVLDTYTVHSDLFQVGRMLRHMCRKMTELSTEQREQALDLATMLESKQPAVGVSSALAHGFFLQPGLP